MPVVTDEADTVSLMSIYHPFPLRMDTAGDNPGDPITTNVQYDACFQIGEFPSPAYPESNLPAKAGNRIVILVPLKAVDNPEGAGAKFINSLGRKIPNILNAQPDFLLGYPETPAATGADWGLASIVELDRPFYTWKTTYNGALNPPQTRVIVMSEPVKISQGDMTNIQSLPITPPEDAIHEIGEVSYHAAPPRAGCKKPVSKPSYLPPVYSPSSFTSKKPEGDPKKKQEDTAKILLSVLAGTVATVILIIGLYFGLKFAMGPLGIQFGKLGESLAGALGAAQKSMSKIPFPKSPMSGQSNVLGRAAQRTRRGLANSLGIGSKFTRRSPRSLNTPTSAAQIANKPPEVPLIPEGNFSVTNPLDATKHKQITGDLGPGLGTPTSPTVADIVDKKPEIPLIPTGTFSITNPGYPNGPPAKTRRETDTPTDPAEARALARAKKNAQSRATQRNPRVSAMDAARKKARELKEKRMKSADALRRITPTSTGLLTASELNRNRPGASDSFRMSENRRLRDRQEAKLNDDDEPAAPAARAERPRRNVGITPSPLLESEMERERQIERRAGRRGRRNNRRKPLKTGRNRM